VSPIQSSWCHRCIDRSWWVSLFCSRASRVWIVLDGSRCGLLSLLQL
jgi:hypothetical protein